MNRYLIIYVCLASFFIACSEESSSTSAALFGQFNPDIEYGKLIDSRDGQTYKTTTIGTQTWMAENLNYETADSYCYKDDATNCSMYGRLYTWFAAMTACPVGWHLPSNAEWETLFTTVGGASTAGAKLKSRSGWFNNGNGTDAFGFSALPAGRSYSGGGYSHDGDFAFFWSTENEGAFACYMLLDYAGSLASLYGLDKIHAFSVRCLKD